MAPYTPSYIKIKDFFFPKFSEKDAFALLLAITLPFIIEKNNLVRLINYLKNMNRPDFTLIMIGTIVSFSFIVIRNLFRNKAMSEDEKLITAKVYYLTLTLITLYSSASYLLSPLSTLNYFDILNIVIVLYLFCKSFITFALMKLFKDNADQFIERVREDQIKPVMVIFMTLFSLILFLILKDRYPLVFIISIIFFYTSCLSGFSYGNLYRVNKNDLIQKEKLF